jgi:hypothetical protein
VLHHRSEILDEVVAGFLWMELAFSDDVSRGELEQIAHRLVGVICAGARQAAIASEPTGVRSNELCCALKKHAIRVLTLRAIATVGRANREHPAGQRRIALLKIYASLSNT